MVSHIICSNQCPRSGLACAVLPMSASLEEHIKKEECSALRHREEGTARLDFDLEEEEEEVESSDDSGEEEDSEDSEEEEEEGDEELQ